MYAVTEQLRRFRKEKGLTQQKIGDLLSMEQTTYAKIEIGKTRLHYETAIKIASIIEKELHEFTTLPITNHSVTGGNTTTTSELKGEVSTNASEIALGKIVYLLEEVLAFFRQYYKDDKI